MQLDQELNQKNQDHSNELTGSELTRSQRARAQKAKKSRVIKTVVAALMLIVIIAAAAYVSSMAWSRSDSKPRVEPGKQVTVAIPEGATATEIAGILEDEGVIKSALVFRLKVRQQGVGSQLKPGEYEMKTGMGYDQIIAMLREGPPIKYLNITLPEGWTAQQMAQRIEGVLEISADEYLSLVNEGKVVVEYPFLKNNGAPTKSLEGYLYPETYKPEKGITAEEFLHMQLGQFQEATANMSWANAQALGRTTYEIVVLASLIERETLVDDERPIVAAVIYNRLEKGMPLQIDATVQYALPEWKDRLTYDDLEVDSPYNTYKNKGLPPGPICNPSASSIEAALNPTADDYLYYVLAPDNSGRHVFTKTYDEFINAKNQYKASRE